jgi:hypothetical protein
MYTLSHNSVTEKLTDIVDWFTYKCWQCVSIETTDSLYIEIAQLKKTLSKTPSKPTRVIRKSEVLEPVTEEQKIMDLSG